MIHYYYHKHKRLIKVFSICLLIGICFIPVLLNYISASADNSIDFGYIGISDRPLTINSVTNKTLINFPTPNSTSGYIGVVLYLDNVLANDIKGSNNYIRIYKNTTLNVNNVDAYAYDNNGNIISGVSFSQSTYADYKQLYLSSAPSNTYISYIVIKFSVSGSAYQVKDIKTGFEFSPNPIPPPEPPAPDEWQTLIEFIGYLIDSVVNVFNLTFSIESKLVWALVFGFPILNFVLDFFDEILDQIDASLPADHDLHKYRPAGYQAPNYYDYHFDPDDFIQRKANGSWQGYT